MQRQSPLFSRIQKNSTLYGNKAANLMELETFCKKLNSKKFQIKVPEIFPISHIQIDCHLGKYARSEWRLDAPPFPISNDFKDPKILQQTIKTTFEFYPLDIEINHPLESLFMVRSSGDEDSEDMANPGGNKSISAVKNDKASLSKAIGEVVASYFSKKSLTQRALSGDDVTKPPFMPVLIQKMVGEKLGGEADADKIIISGVMYTNDSFIRIQVAPGHGELIVNSKSTFDTYDVTKHGVVHAAIYDKQSRLVPDEIKFEEPNGTRKRKLILKDNPRKLQKKSSLPKDIVREIAKVGRKIRAHYKIPMDIEFVFEPHTKILYIVQARPIPTPKFMGVKPSAIIYDEWVKILNNQEIEKIKANVIAPASLDTRILTKSDEVIVATHIALALKQFLVENNKIKAVIIEHPAPSTSHEAALFNSQNIAVFQIEDSKKILAYMKEKSWKIIAIPQYQTLLKWPLHLKDPQIVNGIFSSSMATYKTLLPDSALLSRTIIRGVKKYLNRKPKKPILPTKVYSGLTQTIANLELLRPKKTKILTELLCRITHIFQKLGTSSNAKKDLSGHRLLFKEALISIAEIDAAYQVYSRKVSDIQRNIYLDLINKLKALIVNPGEDKLLSYSLYQLAEQNKILKHYNNRPIKEKAYLECFLKMQFYALNEKTKDVWEKFSVFCSKHVSTKQKLAKILKWTYQYDLKSELINHIFIQHAKKENSFSLLLDKMFQQFFAHDVLSSEYQLIKDKVTIEKWEKMIPAWSERSRFSRLFSEFECDAGTLLKKWAQLNILNIKLDLTKHSILKQMQYFCDVVDQSIKSLKGSIEYRNLEEELVSHFVKLLKMYFEFMQINLKMIPDDYYEKWSSQIEVATYDKNDMLEQLTEIFSYHCDTFSKNPKKHLFPSGCLSVASARIGSTASLFRQLVNEKFTRLTLEDLFSLMHQNILASTVIMGQALQIANEELPDILQLLVKQLNKVKNLDLLGITLTPPKLILEYNLPLRNHGAKFLFEYDLRTKCLVFTAHFFGHNGYGNRMDTIAEFAKLEGRFIDAKYILEFPWDSAKGSLTFTWCLEGHSILLLIQNIQEIINEYEPMTYGRTDHSFYNLVKRYSVIPYDLKNKSQTELNTLMFLQHYYDAGLGFFLKLPQTVHLIYSPDEINDMILKNLEGGLSFVEYERILELYPFMKRDVLMFSKMKTVEDAEKFLHKYPLFMNDLQRVLWRWIKDQTQIQLCHFLMKKGIFVNDISILQAIYIFKEQNEWKTVVLINMRQWDTAKISSWIKLNCSILHFLEISELKQLAINFNYQQSEDSLTFLEIILEENLLDEEFFLQLISHFEINKNIQTDVLEICLKTENMLLFEYFLENDFPLKTLWAEFVIPHWPKTSFPHDLFVDKCIVNQYTLHILLNIAIVYVDFDLFNLVHFVYQKRNMFFPDKICDLNKEKHNLLVLAKKYSSALATKINYSPCFKKLSYSLNSVSKDSKGIPSREESLICRR